MRVSVRVALASLALASACKNAPVPPPLTAPDAPAQVTATPQVTAGVSSIVLTWAVTERATSFVVLRGDAAAGPFDVQATVFTTSYTDPGLPAGTTFYYRVRAANPAGTSAPSAVVSATTPGTAPVPPAAPTGLTATGGSGRISLTWNPSANAATYRVLRSLQAGGPYAVVGRPAAPSYEDLGLDPGAHLFYAVEAVGVDGAISPRSAEANATTAVVAVPTAPAAPSAVGGTRQVALTWSAVATASGYLVLRGTAAGGPYAQVVSTSSTSATDPGLTDGTDYFYVVAATNSAGTGPASPEASAFTLPAQVVLTATGGTRQIALSWPLVASATKYQVFAADTVGGINASGTPLAEPTGTSFTESGLGDGQSRWYAVRAVNPAGNGPLSATQTAATAPPAATPPPTPTGLAATGGTKQIALSWSASTGAASYTLLKGTQAGGPYPTPVASPAATSSTDTGLGDGIRFYYVVKANNAAGSSGNSTEASAFTLPAQVAGLIATGGQNNISLVWNAATGATGYQVFRAAAANLLDTNGAPLAQPTTAGYTDPGLADSATWFYAVRAVDPAGNGPVSAPTSAATNPPAVVPPPAPATLVAVGGARQLSLTWPAVTGASDYLVKRGIISGTWNDLTTLQGTVPASGCVGATCTFADTNGNVTTDGAGPFFYVVESHNAAGYSGNSPEAHAVVLAAAPASLTATAVAGTLKKIALQWSVAPGAATSGNLYALLRATSQNGAYTKQADLTGSACSASVCMATDSPPADGTTYWYQVAAYNSAQVPGPVSVPAQATTIPPAVTGFTATAAGATTITLNWTGVTVQAGASISYRVFRGTALGVTAIGTPVQTIADTGTSGAAYSVPDTLPLANTKYYYVLIATDTGHALDSPLSTEASATTLLAPAPALTATPVLNALSVNLAWATVAATTGFALERADSGGAACPTFPGGSWSPVTGAASLPTSTIAFSDSDAALLAGHTYCYALQPTGGNASNTATALLAAPAPTTLTATTAASDTTGLTIHIDWSFGATAPQGTPTLTFYRCANPGTVACVPSAASTVVKIVNPPGASGAFDDPAGPLAPSTSYSYVGYGSNPTSGSITAGAPTSHAQTGPAVPVVTAVASSPSGVNQIKLAWPKDGGAANLSYLVFRGTDGVTYGDFGAGTAVTTAACTVPPNTCVFIDNASGAGLPGGTVYHYLVRALAKPASTTFTSAASTDASADTPMVAPVVTATAKSGTQGEIDLSWPSVQGAVSYRIWRDQASPVAGNVTFTLAAIIKADTALADNSAHSYVVAAVDGSGAQGPLSAVATATTAPAPATGLTLNTPQAPALARELDLAWTSSTSVGATYVIQRALHASGSFVTVNSTSSTSLKDTALADSTSYDYQVQSTLGGTASAFTAVQTATTTPPQVTSLAKAGATASSIDLSWTAIGGSASLIYKVYRGPASPVDTSGAPAFTAVGASSAGASDTGLAPNTTYFYKVLARDTANSLDGPASAELSATTQPAAAGVLNASAVSSQLTVDFTWGLVAGVPSYSIQRYDFTGAACPGSYTGPGNGWAQVPGADTASLGASASSAHDTDAALQAGHSYCYVLLPTNGTPSSPTSVILAAPPPTTLTAAITGAAGLTVHLAWSYSALPPGTASLVIYRCNSPGALPCTATTGSTLLTSTTSTIQSGTYDDTAVAAGTSYGYLALGSNSSGAYQTGAPSAPALTGPAVPASFQALAGASGGKDNVTLTWAVNATGTYTGYSLLRGLANGASGSYTDPGFPKPIAPASCTATTCTAFDDASGAGLPPGTNYHYAVQAVSNRGGAGTFTSASSADASAATLLAAPVLNPAVPKSGTAGEIDLSWQATPGASIAYNLWRDPSSAAPVEAPLFTGLSATAKADTGLAVHAAHTYLVAPVGSNGVQGPFSNVSASVFTAPGTVTPSAAAQDGVNGRIDVAWANTAASGANTYLVTRVGLGTIYNGAYPGAGFVSDTGLGDNALTNYQVVAVDAAGTFSPAASATATTVPSAPTGLSAVAPQSPPATRELDLSWTAPPAGATGYTVLRSPSGANTFSPILSPGATNAKDTSGLSDVTAYDYEVQAVNVSGKSSGPSAIKTGTTTPAQVTALTAAANATTPATAIDLTWAVTPPGGARINYRVYRSTTSGLGTGGTLLTPGTSNATALTDRGLSPATPYYYVVVAQDANAPNYVGPVSAEQTATTQAAQKPTLTATNVQNTLQVNLGWNLVAGATGYRVQRIDGTTGGCPAYNGPGNGWADVTGAGSLAPNATSTTDMTFAASDAGHTWCYDVIPSGAGTLPSSVASALLAAPPPSTLTPVTLAPGSGGPTTGTTIRVSWSYTGAPAGTASVDIYRCSNAGTAGCTPSIGVPVKSFASPGASGGFDDTGLTPATTYSYTALGTNTSGQYAAGAVTSSATTGPAAPQGVGANAHVSTGNTITVTWNRIVDGTVTTGYSVLRGAANGSAGVYGDTGFPKAVANASCGATTCSYDDNSLPNGTSYHYAVEAVSGPFASAASSDASASTQSSAPANLIAVASAPGTVRQIQLNWGAATGATSYDVYRSTSAIGTPSGGVYCTTGSVVTFTDTGGGCAAGGGLPAGTTYHYVVTLPASVSNKSNEATALTAPLSPAPLTFSAADGPACPGSKPCVTLMWSATATATSYNLYRADLGPTPFYTTSTIAFVDTNLSADASYTYAVEAVNTGGASPQAAVTAATLPASINSLTAVPSASSRQVLVGWTLPSGSTATGIWIYRTPHGQAFNYGAPVASNQPAGSPFTWLDTTVAFDANYDYEARLGIGANVSAVSSNTAAGALVIPAAPAPVFSSTTSSATAASGGTPACTTPDCIFITWPALPADVTSYQVLGSGTGAAGSYIAIANASSTLLCTVSTCTFVESGLLPGTPRYYQVTAANPTGTGPKGFLGQAAMTPPNAPTALTADGGIGQITVGWSGSGDQFKIQRRLSSKGGSYGAGVIVTSAPCVDKAGGGGTCSLDGITTDPIHDGLAYDYQITAQVVTTSGVVDGGSSTITGQVFPAAPTGLVGNRNGVGSVQLQWTSSNCATSTGPGHQYGPYDLFAAVGAPGEVSPTQPFNAATPDTYVPASNPCTPDASGAITLLTSITGSSSSTAIGDGLTYWFELRARNAGVTGDNLASAPSTPLKVTLLPSTPGGLAAAAVAGKLEIDVSWSASAGATSYNVYRGTSAGSLSLLPGGTGATSPFKDTTVSANVPYYYTVTAVNAGGESLQQTTPAHDTATGAAALAPNGVVAVGLHLAAKILWTSVTTADSYSVYQRSASGVATGEALKCTALQPGTLPATVSCVVPSLVNKSTDYFVVRSKNAGVESPDSTEVSATPAKELCVSLPEMSAVVTIDAENVPGPNGNIEVFPRRWFGNVGQMAVPVAVAVDQTSDEAFVLNQAAGTVTVYSPRSPAGLVTAPPRRTLAGKATHLFNPTGMVLDPAAHELFVTNGDAAHKLLVFAENSSSTSFGASPLLREFSPVNASGTPVGALTSIALGPAPGEVTISDGVGVFVYPRTWPAGSPPGSAHRFVATVTAGAALSSIDALATNGTSTTPEIWVGGIAASTATVAAIAGNGTTARFFTQGSSSINTVLSLAYDPLGNAGVPQIIVGSRTATVRTIASYPQTASGTVPSPAVPSYSMGGSATNSISLPLGIAVDTGGGVDHILVASRSTGLYEQMVSTFGRQNNGIGIAPVGALVGPWQANSSATTDSPQGLAATGLAGDQLWEANLGLPGGASGNSAASIFPQYAMADAVLNASYFVGISAPSVHGVGIAVNTTSSEVYVSDSGGSTVSRFRQVDGSLIGGIGSFPSTGPSGLYWDWHASTTSSLYVAEASGGPGTGAVTVWPRLASNAFAAAASATFAPATCGGGGTAPCVVQPVAVWMTPTATPKLWVANTTAISGSIGPGAVRIDPATGLLDYGPGNPIYSANSNSLTPTSIVTDATYVYIGLKALNSTVNSWGVQLVSGAATGAAGDQGLLQIAGVTHTVGGLAWCNGGP